MTTRKNIMVGLMAALFGFALSLYMEGGSGSRAQADEPGGWVTLPPIINVTTSSSRGVGTTPDFTLSWLGVFQNGGWTGTSTYSAGVSSSHAHVTGHGYCDPALVIFGATSWTGTAIANDAAYHWTQQTVWQGAGPPTSRPVDLSAAGTGSERITADASAKAGTTGSASASGFGSANTGLTPHGATQPANITVQMAPINLQSQFNSASNSWSVLGNILTPVAVTGPNFTGNVSAAQTQAMAQSGTGSVTGTASFSAIAGVYNETTDLGYIIEQYGTTTAEGTGQFVVGGTIDFTSDSSVDFSVSGG